MPKKNLELYNNEAMREVSIISLLLCPKTRRKQNIE